MKKLYLAAMSLLLANSYTGLLEAGIITISNQGTIPLQIIVQSKYKNKNNNTRHDQKTMILAPCKTPFVKPIAEETKEVKKVNAEGVTEIIKQVAVQASPGANAVLADNGKGTDTFDYKGGLQFVKIYDATNPTSPKLLKAHGSMLNEWIDSNRNRGYVHTYYTTASKMEPSDRKKFTRIPNAYVALSDGQLFGEYRLK